MTSVYLKDVLRLLADYDNITLEDVHSIGRCLKKVASIEDLGIADDSSSETTSDGGEDSDTDDLKDFVVSNSAPLEYDSTSDDEPVRSRKRRKI